jgi:hypothetical protein
MLKNAYRSGSAVALAALVAGAVTILSGASERVIASAPIHSGKGDRLDIRPLGAACSQQAWPYFETRCVRDRRMGLGRPKAARVVATDHVGVAR